MVEFNPDVLVLAREARGLTQAALVRKLPVHVRQGTISKIENRMIQMPDELLEQIALSLEYPVHFFSQKDTVYGFGSSIFYHRKQQGLGIKILRKLHAQLNIKRNHIKRLLRSAELDSRVGFQYMDPQEYGNDIEKIAQLARGAWRLPSGPIRNLIDAIESNGGIIVRFNFGTRKADAISEWTEMCPPIFFSNSHPEISADRDRNTLAHELGHVIMHKFPTPNMEDEAKRFSAEFLLPTREIKPYLNRLNLPKLAALKREWKVSMSSLVQRAYQLGTITPSQRRYLLINLRKRTHSFREPPETNIPFERPRALERLIEFHMSKLGYSAKQMGDLLAEKESNFRAMYLPNIINFPRLVSM